MNTERVMVIAGIRTPFSKAGSELAGLDASDLGRAAVLGLLARTGIDPGRIDEVILGCVAQPADALNLARVVALRSGIPRHVPAMTVQRNCASGIEAITQAVLRIRAGDGGLFLVGGVESMTAAPFLFSRKAATKLTAFARAGSMLRKTQSLLAMRPGDFKPIPALKVALADPVVGLNMGETAELLAREYAIPREEQDEFALRSHTRAADAASRLSEEITPAYDTKRGTAIQRDNGVRPHQTMQALGKLPPVFEKHTGTVTAGNSSQISDGAAALLVASESVAEKLGVQPLGAIGAFAFAGCDPERMGLGPVYAIEKLLERTHSVLEDADLVEINEAFAAQVLAVLRMLKSEGIGAVPDEILNVDGGAIALGHPVGASGARLVLTALKELRRRKAGRALVSLCAGGGQGAALWLEAA